MFIKWSEDHEPISEPFSAKIVYEKVAWQPFIANLIPYTILDQASKFNISFSPILLHMEQTQFTFIMLCVDLNINYEDEMAEHFPFAIIN